MSAQAGSGRASARQSGPGAEASPRLDGNAVEDRAILSFTLLISVIAAGFVIALGLAEANPALTTTLSNLLN